MADQDDDAAWRVDAASARASAPATAPDSTWRAPTIHVVPLDQEPFVAAIPAGVRLIPVDHDPVFADDTGYERATLLPFRTNVATGHRELAWPAAIAGPARAFARLMDGASAGQPPNIDDAITASSVMAPGALLGRSALARAALPEGAAAAESVGGNMASRKVMIYNPPVKPPRPFAADYRAGAATDEAGRLTADIEGRPLTARLVVGRTSSVETGETALSSEGIDAVAADATGAGPERVAARELGGNAGAYMRYYDPKTGTSRQRILIYRGLSPAQDARVTAHEVGHAIDEIAGQIPTEGLNNELRDVYNTLATGQERTRIRTGPEHLGYSKEDVPRELMAEAIRGYMTNPNYLKTVAPKTAKAIRDAVNTHPTLSKIIQFNAIGAGALQLVPVDHDPFD